ncbi:hypothetical protein RhiirA4_466918 [Rhizophagus irregularis]|uniref:Uncharacterized protein n=1 Tax=Rhizophagus irregularis TaxID=588596 RepID=A0A2I1GUV3_9GLOM|nr:hypothetical protein RhiirA4_466918 [Rhizophagus irregularis]
MSYLYFGKYFIYTTTDITAWSGVEDKAIIFIIKFNDFNQEIQQYQDKGI